MNVLSHLLPDVGCYIEGKRTLIENIVFNLAGVVSSSWPSCLLSAVDPRFRLPVYLIILF